MKYYWKLLTAVCGSALTMFTYEVWAAYNLYDPFWGAP